MDGVFVAWVGVAVAGIIQLSAVAFFIGTMRQEIRGVRIDLNDHRNMKSQRAHPTETQREQW